MEINISISGKELDDRKAAKQLHLIADMVKAGVVHMEGESVAYMGEFFMAVDTDEHEHTDYWDGEHNHLHVDEEGIIISRRGPDKADGTEDLENVHEQGIKLAEWANEHGGITPFDTPLDGHDHEH